MNSKRTRVGGKGHASESVGGGGGHDTEPTETETEKMAHKKKTRREESVVMCTR